MQTIGATQPMIDRWLQCNDLARRLREGRATLTTCVYLDDHPRARKPRRAVL